MEVACDVDGSVVYNDSVLAVVIPLSDVEGPDIVLCDEVLSVSVEVGDGLQDL